MLKRGNRPPQRLDLGEIIANPHIVRWTAEKSIHRPRILQHGSICAGGFKVPGLESGKVQVGAQAYNVLNHPNFQNPDFNVSSPTFGSIVSTASTSTSAFGSFLGGDASPRIVQLKAVFQFSRDGERSAPVSHPFAEPPKALDLSSRLT